MVESTVPGQRGLSDFQANSPYTRVVDLKKLQFIHQALERYVVRSRKAPSEMTILEAGCGFGGVTLSLASFGSHVVAFDIDEKAVATIEREQRFRGFDNLEVEVASVYGFDDRKFYDVVIMSELLVDLDRPEDAFRNTIARVGSGGFVIVTVPNGYGPYELISRFRPRALLGRSSTLRRLLGRPEDRRGSGTDRCTYYTHSGLLDLAARHSLTLLAERNSDFLSPLTSATSTNRRMACLDTRLADAVPAWIASGWYFLFRAP